MGTKSATYFKQYVMLAYGIVFQAIGVAIMYYSNLGSAPVAVFNEGLAMQCGISIGTANTINNSVVVLLALLQNRRYVSVATFFLTFCTGPAMDYGMELVGYLVPEVVDFPTQMIMLFLATFITCIGVGVIVAADAGVAAFEAFAIPLSLKIHLPYKYLCVLMNAVYAFSGWLMGGQVGLLTLVFGVLSGFIIAFTTKVATNTVAKWFGVAGLAID